jgi:hypothetical protein
MSLRDCFLMDTKLYLIKPYASFGKLKLIWNLKKKTFGN